MKLYRIIEHDAEQWHDNSTLYSTSLLLIVSVGLIFVYIVLIYNMRRYFRQEMKQEMRRLTVLFATFVFAYLLRSFYQIGLISYSYAHWVTEMAIRWYILNALPLIWDVLSILSILVLHRMSFRKSSEDRATQGRRRSLSPIEQSKDGNNTPKGRKSGSNYMRRSRMLKAGHYNDGGIP